MKYIRDLMFIDGVMMTLGIIASTIVAIGLPQPYFWFAFPTYAILAVLGVWSNYLRGSPLMWMFAYFLMIDTFGIYRWWPW